MTTKASPLHPLAGNLLNREFEVDRPNRKWVTDITYLPTTEGWLYLATVMDLFSRKIVGWRRAVPSCWALNERLHTLLVMDALNMAWQRRQPEAGLLHHSDRGSQNTRDVYRRALERLKAVQSMSNKGACWDNAVQESFFSTLKVELDLQLARGTRAQTRSEVCEWIEVFYNRQRRHSSLSYRSPVAFEEQAPYPELSLH
ncbi:IS3 family transposase [Deinococcus aerolatus]|nr:IS3 family transposase [Deinococcus aerolatus]